ncbi:MAG: helix-turn-helix transcriptional regulator [Coriobacteriales bacterium]|jgi:DNA-binding CsgD family transcriptional regulator|nr:helix-turn-helix transcriptional regulator [Coriobacteriales bacterium]
MQRGTSLIGTIASELRAHPLITLGFSLFWTWVWLVVQSSALNAGVFAGLMPGIGRWVIPLTAYGMTFLVMGILFRQLRFLPYQKGYLILLACMTSIGVAINATFTFYPTIEPLVTTALLVLGGLLMGTGTAMIHMEWGRILGRLGPRKTVIHGALGTCGAMILIFILFLLSDIVTWCFVAFLPIGCIATIILQRRTLVVVELPSANVKLNVPWRFLCTSFIQGTAFGILQTLLLTSSASAQTTAITVVGSLIGAAAVLVVVLHFRWDFNQLIYQVGFVLLALSFVLMALASSVFIGGWLINAIGYRFIDILMWALCTHLVKQRHLPTNWVFAITTCALLMGQVFGALMGAVVEMLPLTAPTVISDGGGTSLLASLMVFIILTSALLLFNKDNLQVGWGMIRPGDEDDQTDSFQIRCTLATDGFELTPRETELFALLAQGMNRDDISTRLYLSRETVKTHTRNIYRKMDLHSQEQVIDLVAQQQAVAVLSQIKTTL